MARRALLVGIDDYAHAPPLAGCVTDALALRDLLGRNADASPNYDCQVLLGEPGREPTTRARLREACERLFVNFRGEALFYFSGHGTLTSTGGYLVTHDAAENDVGVSMDELFHFANSSEAADIVVILDCCHSGAGGNPRTLNRLGGANPLSSLRENITVIAASRDVEPAVEAGGHGLFTAAVLDALDGGAADHMGWVTAPSIYAYVERRFGPWDQRPVYKTHATGLGVIRRCAPLIDRQKLHQLVELFPREEYRFRLDPEYEPEDEHGRVHEPVNERKLEVARLFKEYRDAGLLKPSDPREQLYWTARHGHTVELTLRGKEYWRLVKGRLI